MANQYTKAKPPEPKVNDVPQGADAAIAPAPAIQLEAGGTPTSIYGAGGEDARQGGNIVPSRFRPVYRRLNEQELQLHDAIKQKAIELEALFAEANTINETHAGSQYNTQAVTALELAVMWAVKGLTA